MSSLIIYDTEYTAWDGSQKRKWSEPWEHREIIQIGAVKLELHEGLREIDFFNVLVKPQINPQLSGYIIKLTGITQEQIEKNGVSFLSAMEMFLHFAGQDGILACNHKDYIVIEENYELQNRTLPIKKNRFLNINPFLSYYTNSALVVSSDRIRTD